MGRIHNTFRELNLLPKSQKYVLKMINPVMWQYPFLCYTGNKTEMIVGSKCIVWSDDDCIIYITLGFRLDI